jgi:hypothetical protein
MRQMFVVTLAALYGAANDDGGSELKRSCFLALLGISVNILSALVILTAAVPQLIHDRCE